MIESPTMSARFPSTRAVVCLAFFGAGLWSYPVTALADDPVCAVRAAATPMAFSARGEVDFGPGFRGTLGATNFGLDYNLLLQGDYDWNMPGELRTRWPPFMRVSAIGTPNGGRLTVQYGLRLQATLRLFGLAIPVPIDAWVGMADRSERGMSMFTPWAWQPEPTAVRVTASERLIREGDLNNVPVLNTVHYRVYGSYELTTTVRTREISFPQAMSAITEAMPEADVAPTANGDMNLPATWNGTLRYVGSLRIRVEVEYRVCVSVICSTRRDTLFNGAVPFASSMEQQMSVDRSIRLTLPGAATMPEYRVDLGRIQLGRQGREVITLSNPGRATVLFTPTAPTEPAFEVATDPLCVNGGANRPLSVRFTPTREGAYESDFLIATSSPSVPTVMLRLVGEAYDPLSTRDSGTVRVDGGTARDSGGEADDAAVTDDAGAVDGDGGEVLYEQPVEGCGCRAAGSTPARGRWWAMGLGALALLSRRRRRARPRREGST